MHLGFAFFIQSHYLYLYVGVFITFTFNVIIDIFMFKSSILLFVFHLFRLFFASRCSFLTFFGIIHIFLLLNVTSSFGFLSIPFSLFFKIILITPLEITTCIFNLHALFSNNIFFHVLYKIFPSSLCKNLITVILLNITALWCALIITYINILLLHIL